jgi:type I restriction enzyme M protein
VDIILANPPFGSSTEQAEIQQNFPILSGETAYMFLQHFIKILRAGGRCGVVIKNTFLSNTDNASIALRKQLLEECEVTAILDLPKGAFTGTGVQTIVLFFTKGKPTTKVWYYQLNLARNLGKTNSLNEQDLAEFVKTSAPQTNTENSWLVDVKDIDKTTWDLTVSNPNRVDTSDKRTPEQILKEIEQLDLEAATAIAAIKELL